MCGYVKERGRYNDVVQLKSISILACGESGSQWDGQGISIGVNDCWKFGKPTTYLLCVQTIQQWNRQPKERLQTIIKSTPEKFYTHKQEWTKYFAQTEVIKIKRWNGRLNGQIQFSRTSPFIAIIMAHLWGYDHIKLFGVDFTTHQHYSEGNSKDFGSEMKNYRELMAQLKAKGVTFECPKESYINQFT